MAKISAEIVSILRKTAYQLQSSDKYMWGHMGACNCGFLAQQVTRLSQAEIHRRALMGQGDWSEQLNDYCPDSGLMFDDIVDELLSVGFDINELRHLENLTLPEVLNEFPGKIWTRNNKEEVVVYINTWADLLETRLLSDADISSSVYITDRELEFSSP